MPDFMYYEIWGNPIVRYALFLVCFVAGCVLVRIAGAVLLKRLSKPSIQTKTKADGILVRSIRRYVLPLAYFAALYLNLKILTLGPRLTALVNTGALAVGMILAALFASSVAVLLFNRYWEARGKDAGRDLAVRMLSGLLKAVIWGTALILFLDNIGVEINTLIAGVGIGGIAFAFAAQTILGDIFCFITIFFDRPFELGDFITAGGQSGTVEHIGLKTTRLRALGGEQLIFSNTDLTSARIQNYKTMAERRVLFTLGVTYDTPPEKLREIPGLMKGIVESAAGTRFARCHFVSFGDYSLNIETAYFILSSDYDTYLDIHQQVNLAVKEVFDKNGVAFAFPTTTVALARED